MTQNRQQVADTLEKAQVLAAEMLTIARFDAIFSKPLEIDGKQVVMASEVGAALGVGQVWRATGGGGTSQGRPVAAITVENGQVQVKPVFDATKIGLALLTAVVSFFTLWRSMRSTHTRTRS